MAQGNTLTADNTRTSRYKDQAGDIFACFADDRNGYATSGGDSRFVYSSAGKGFGRLKKDGSDAGPGLTSGFDSRLLLGDRVKAVLLASMNNAATETGMTNPVSLATLEPSVAGSQLNTVQLDTFYDKVVTQ